MKKFVMGLTLLLSASAFAENCSRESILEFAKINSIIGMEEQINMPVSTHNFETDNRTFVKFHLHAVGYSGNHDLTEVNCNLADDIKTIKSIRLYGRVVSQ